MMSKGVLMYAHNNPEIDYIKIACANALMVQRNLHVPVTLVTDSGSLAWCKESVGDELVAQCFEKIIIVDVDSEFNNKRSYGDTSFSTKTLQFYNCNHWAAYDLSPYDETLFIDADYLIMSDSLSNCWGSQSDVMINYHIFDTVSNKTPYFKYIDEFGIRQYWATVIYFNKSTFSKYLFDLVRHVQENYTYFRDLYYFSNGMYRNDNAFSVALHMLNGYTDSNFSTDELPIPGMLMSWEREDTYEINGVNDITIYAEQPTPGKYILVRLKNQDVHIMNKWAINRHADTLINLYKDLA